MFVYNTVLSNNEVHSDIIICYWDLITFLTGECSTNLVDMFVFLKKTIIISFTIAKASSIRAKPKNRNNANGNILRSRRDFTPDGFRDLKCTTNQR
jgi:hypothetical protein